MRTVRARITLGCSVKTMGIEDIACQIVRDSPMIILILDETGHITYGNHAFTAISELTPQQFVGKPLDEVLSWQHYETFLTVIEGLRNSSHKAGPFCIKGTNTQKEYELRAQMQRLINTFGKPLFVLEAHGLGELEIMAFQDSVTGLPNRHAYNKDIKSLLPQAERQSYEIGILFLDIRNFKRVNDKYGHIVGDKLLADVGRFLRESIRSSDYLYRYGGDEFLVILPNSGEAGTEQLAHKLESNFKGWLSEPFDSMVGLDIGLAVYQPAKELNLEYTIRIADARMYRKKAMAKALELSER